MRLKKFNEDFEQENLSGDDFIEGHLLWEEGLTEWIVVTDDDNEIIVMEEHSDMLGYDMKFDDRPCKYRMVDGKAFLLLVPTTTYKLG